MISERLQKCGTWWNGKDEAERFLLYYSCLRYHYELPANEALSCARKNWALFGEAGDLMSALRKVLNHEPRKTT